MAAAPVTDELLETAEIQGLLLRGYGTFTAARFLVLAVRDEEIAREYLRGLCDRLNLARDTPEAFALQVAFTAKGLERLGVPATTLVTFSREFTEGMDDELRADLLGDRGDNDPKDWTWGKQAEPVHVLLLAYALNADVMTTELGRELTLLAAGFEILHDKPSSAKDDQKEHFGWRDGVSMPTFTGVPHERPKKKHQESWTTPIAPGEFILGYRNDYGAYTERPTVDPEELGATHLPLAPDGIHRDLGRNGTYLVFREMTQDVLGFWDYLEKTSREPGSDPVERAIALGAKLVGRWPSGAPLIRAPKADAPEHANDNAFMYRKDRAGLACPHGAHIRRANPRDVLAVEDRGSDASLQMVRKHQMIRRGRPFGPRVTEALDPRAILEARDRGDTERRGLYFICLVGSISRQFEFPQRAWIQSANFDSLCKDGDPIAGARRPAGDENPNDEFTCPATPVRRKYKQMPQFTRLCGGGYFFLPGISALRFISRHS